MAGHRPLRDLVAYRMKDWSPERRARYEARKAKFAARNGCGRTERPSRDA